MHAHTNETVAALHFLTATGDVLTFIVTYTKHSVCQSSLHFGPVFELLLNLLLLSAILARAAGEECVVS